ncbi:thiamine pyrophosphate-binding protein [Pseudonocardia eucalypti]|uniref:Thiamine pyrophosphate-binding protein n=1 Tax=Pseudonocardia eucalypti TaxID=648755 RepID=A0ABP9R1G5_9PSEU|nr:thiamine pyrophosphate-dependent acetolactate synthase large subunit-like protein [Pseudonocardia eucalypti]
MRVAELVGRTLARLGAGPVFGVVGSGNLRVTNALRAHGVRFVATRHEAGAATMADACARMSGRVAVATTHQGCGLSNAVTGIGEAAKSRTPMLVLAADTAGSAVLSNFRIDQDALVRAVGAVPERVHSADTAVADTVRAYRTALQQRRTVVLNLPLDVQELDAPETDAPETDLPGADLPGADRLGADPPGVAPVVVAPASPIRPDPDAVTALAGMLARARRPVFVAGRGAREAAAPLRALAESTGALLATSAVAHGLFHDEPWSLGISGGFATPLAAELISDADLVVGWGCALNMWTMRHGRLINPAATVVQVDVEQAALGAHRPVHLGVLGDAGQTAADALAALRGHQGDAAGRAGAGEEGVAGEHRATGYRTPEIAGRIAAEGRWNQVAHTDLSTETAIDPRTLTARLDELLPADRLVAVDSGNFMGYPSAYLGVPDEFGFCFTQAFQSVGLGLATAIGAAVARPDRLTVAALGDGGFHMGVAELDTAVRLRLPMVVVVYNDAAYGAEVHHFVEDDLGTVKFPDTDIASVGRGFGCAGLTVRTLADLEEVGDWLAGPRDKPLVIDAKIADDGGSWWLAEAFRGH